MRRYYAAALIAVLALVAVAAADSPARPQPGLLSALAHQDGHAHKTGATIAQGAAVPDGRVGATACAQGMAGPFPCDGVDLLSFVPLAEFANTATDEASDVWGWTDPDNGDEYVLLGKTSGASFFRVTDPTNPVYLGDLPTESVLAQVWYDIKVYANHAFIVSESVPYGMRVFDLTRLRGVTTPQTFTEDASFPLPTSAHNIAINTDTGYAYVVGGNTALVVPDQCLSGLNMIDIREPKNPTFAGCGGTGDGPGTLLRTLGLNGVLAGVPISSYIHDTQCVTYTGPDPDYAGREVCLNSSEIHVRIVDVTDKASPTTISTLSYPQTGYTHQGWLTEDQRYFLFNDELDEMETGANTRTLIADVSDLDNPVLVGEYIHETASIDHNLYTRGGNVFESNYTSGLRIFSTARVGSGVLDPVGFFDTFPDNDDAQFAGTWSNYPYFDSGTIAVSGINEGLFLVRPQAGILTAGGGA